MDNSREIYVCGVCIGKCPIKLEFDQIRNDENSKQIDNYLETVVSANTCSRFSVCSARLEDNEDLTQ